VFYWGWCWSIFSFLFSVMCCTSLLVLFLLTSILSAFLLITLLIALLVSSIVYNDSKHSLLVNQGFFTPLSKASVINIWVKRRVWRYQRDNQKPYIEEEQTTQWPKEKVQKDKQRSTKHTYKTKDRVKCRPSHFPYCHNYVSNNKLSSK
jgi:hypothetical protein